MGLECLPAPPEPAAFPQLSPIFFGCNVRRRNVDCRASRLFNCPPYEPLSSRQPFRLMD